MLLQTDKVLEVTPTIFFVMMLRDMRHVCVCRSKRSVTGLHSKLNVARARRSQVRRLPLLLGWAAEASGLRNASQVPDTRCGHRRRRARDQCVSVHDIVHLHRIDAAVLPISPDPNNCLAADLLEPSLPAAAPSGAAARLGRLGSFSPARGSVRRGKR